MIEPGESAPPPIPHRVWIVRMLAPRPASSLREKLGEVLRRTLWLLPCEFVLIILMSVAGLPADNAGTPEIGEMLDRGPIYFLLMGAVFAPILEEILFRGLPSLVSDLLLRRKHHPRWGLGVPMALVFALAHNLSDDAGPHEVALIGNLYFHLSFPAAQFVFGLLLWDLMRRYGLWAATLSHMLHNLVFLSLAFVEGSPS